MFVLHVASLFQIARIMVQTFLKMRAELKAAKMKVEELEGGQKQQVNHVVRTCIEHVASSVAFYFQVHAQRKTIPHTPLNAPGPQMRIVIQGEEEEEEEEEMEQDEEEEEEVGPPPAKQRKIEGLRAPVPLSLERKRVTP